MKEGCKTALYVFWIVPLILVVAALDWLGSLRRRKYIEIQQPVPELFRWWEKDPWWYKEYYDKI